MSRVGNKPIAIPKGVDVQVGAGSVQVKGPKGSTAAPILAGMTVVTKDGKIQVSRGGEEKQQKALHGLNRALLMNAVLGVTEGYKKALDLVGIGFKAEVKGKEIHFALGFSHPVVFKLPEGITAEVDPKQTRITVKGVDKHLLGLTAAKIRGLREPEPYKGKGIKYANEIIRRKEGKTGAA